ncbi:hypothetical protein VTN02DRAFT_3634 [Thermoascus thermophilus]
MISATTDEANKRTKAIPDIRRGIVGLAGFIPYLRCANTPSVCAGGTREIGRARSRRAGAPARGNRPVPSRLPGYEETPQLPSEHALRGDARATERRDRRLQGAAGASPTLQQRERRSNWPMLSRAQTTPRFHAGC